MTELDPAHFVKTFIYKADFNNKNGVGLIIEGDGNPTSFPNWSSARYYNTITEVLDLLDASYYNAPYYSQYGPYLKLEENLQQYFNEQIGKYFPGYYASDFDGSTNLLFKINGIDIGEAKVTIDDGDDKIGSISYPKNVHTLNTFMVYPDSFPGWYFIASSTESHRWNGAQRPSPSASLTFSIPLFAPGSIVDGKIVAGSRYVETYVKIGYYSYPKQYELYFHRSSVMIFNDSRLLDLVFQPFGEPEDPYEPGGTSSPGDLPAGTFDDTSDTIPLPPLPTLSAANTGFTRIYNPTLSQVQALARYLWTDETVIQTIWNHIKQYFEDPMQAIIGFNLVPVTVPDGGTQNFALMYIDTGVSMTVAANQFVDVDCGTLSLERYYGSALDQSPYTKVHCFLPFIGTVQLDTDEVMGTTLSVNYRVDIVSGSCVASILVDGNVLYQYSGHCAITIPFSSADFSNYVSAAIQVGKLIGMAVAGGIGAAVAGAISGDAQQETGNTLTTTIETINTARNPATGRQVTTGTTRQVVTAEQPQTQSQTKASFAGLSPANVANTVGQVISSKPVIQRSGSFSGNSGYLGVRRPYLIIQRPRMCLPANYQTLNGYPAMITMVLGECKGYTRVQQVQLTGLSATNPEQAEILELLKSGVVF